jgi:hypothetical protein
MSVRVGVGKDTVRVKDRGPVPAYHWLPAEMALPEGDDEEEWMVLFEELSRNNQEVGRQIEHLR